MSLESSFPKLQITGYSQIPQTFSKSPQDPDTPLAGSSASQDNDESSFPEDGKSRTTIPQLFKSKFPNEEVKKTRRNSFIFKKREKSFNEEEKKTINPLHVTFSRDSDMYKNASHVCFPTSKDPYTRFNELYQMPDKTVITGKNNSSPLSLLNLHNNTMPFELDHKSYEQLKRKLGLLKELDSLDLKTLFASELNLKSENSMKYTLTGSSSLESKSMLQLTVSERNLNYLNSNENTHALALFFEYFNKSHSWDKLYNFLKQKNPDDNNHAYRTNQQYRPCINDLGILTWAHVKSTLIDEEFFLKTKYLIETILFFSYRALKNDCYLFDISLDNDSVKVPIREILELFLENPSVKKVVLSDPILQKRIMAFTWKFLQSDVIKATKLMLTLLRGKEKAHEFFTIPNKKHLSNEQLVDSNKRNNNFQTIKHEQGIFRKDTNEFDDLVVLRNANLEKMFKYLGEYQSAKISLIKQKINPCSQVTSEEIDSFIGGLNDIDLNELSAELKLQEILKPFEIKEKKMVLIELLKHPLRIKTNTPRGLVNSKEFIHDTCDKALLHYVKTMHQIAADYPNYISYCDAFKEFSEAKYVEGLTLLLKNADRATNNVSEALPCLIKDLILRTTDAMYEQHDLTFIEKESVLKEINKCFERKTKGGEIVKVTNWKKLIKLVENNSTSALIGA